METIKIDDFKREQKRRERNAKIRKTINDAVNFLEDHKEGVSMAAALALGGYQIAKSISSNHKTKKKLKAERIHRDLEIYDHSTGKYLKLKRPMKTVEDLEYAARCRKGEPKVFILHDMGLLKN